MTLLTRLDATATRISDLRNTLRAEMRRRDQMICEAIYLGETYKTVSKASHRSIGTVAEIVGRGAPDDDE
jgi:hypothetical protein